MNRARARRARVALATQRMRRRYPAPAPCPHPAWDEIRRGWISVYRCGWCDKTTSQTN